MSFNKSVGWADCSINPIKGLCQGGCWYCYYSGGRGIARRFKQDPELRLDLSVFDKLPKKPKRIFLCSTNDYWGDWIPDEWREAIRAKTQEYPQHTFLLLTKQPRNLVSFFKNGFPDNWWVGVTATDREQYLMATGWQGLDGIEAKIKFISFEPLLGQIGASDYRLNGVNWIIVGRLTGYGHKHDPKIEWIEEIVRACDKAGVPVFLKENLKRIYMSASEVVKHWDLAMSTICVNQTKQLWRLNDLRQELPG